MATKEAPKPRTKVVVRMLPANLTADAFWKLIEEKVTDRVDWWYYSGGKASQKKYAHSKAFLDFKNPDFVYDFRDFFHGHTFVNARGGEDRATVEYAPYPKVPKAKKKVDPRGGTIETDPDYVKFLETLNQEVVTLPSAEVQLDKRLAEEKEKIAAAGGVAPPVLTPIIEEIRAKRAARNAPRTILQAPKRRGDRSKRDRNAAGDKKKDDERRKARRERGGRKRDEKKKKREEEKKDGIQTEVVSGTQPVAATAAFGQQQPPKDRERRRDRDKSKDKDKEGKGRNGLWMIKRHLEPGSIQIQARDKAGAVTTQQPQQAQPPQPHIQILQHQPQQAQVPAPQAVTGVLAQPQAQPQQPQQPQQQYQRRQDYGRGGKGQRATGRPPRAQAQAYTPKQAVAAQQPQQETSVRYNNYMEGV